MMIPQELTAKLEAFLATRSRGDGGWAPVSERDLEDLYGIMNLVLETKYEQDVDGDLPVQYQLVDRTRCEPMHFMPVPYSHNAETEEQIMSNLDTHLVNLEIATSAVRNASHLRRHFVDMRLRAKKEKK